MIDNSKSSFPLSSNLVGRIRNIALSPSSENTIFPLLEAIMNSIQAIQDRFEEKDIKKGLIEVDITLSDDHAEFIIKDNGVGFNDKNFTSFLTPDSDFKLQKGGKGVGRLTWLKIFNNVRIESEYEDDGQFYKRTFNFQCDNDEQIKNYKYERADDDQKIGTKITLIGMKPEYLACFPKKGSTLSDNIFRHFLPLIFSNNKPNIILVFNRKIFNLSKDLKDIIIEQSYKEISFERDDKSIVKLKLRHMRIPTRIAPVSSPKNMAKKGAKHNAVYYSANQRVCFDYVLDNQLGMTDFDKSKYIGILEGEFIDSHMNQERTHLDINSFEDKKIKDEIMNSVTDFLSVFMEKVKTNQEKNFQHLNNILPSIVSGAPNNYIKNLPYSIVKDEDMIGNLALLKLRRYKSVTAKQISLKKSVEEVNSSDKPITLEQKTKIEDDVNSLRSKLNHEAKTSLIDYILRRKAIIDLLDSYMALSDEGNFYKEEMVHNLICPIGKIDNTKKLLDHNLWLLDDRFAFYEFLASDVALDKFTETKHKDRPDVLFVLDIDLAFKRSNSSPIFIIEFKRPNKKNYSTGSKQEFDKEDPFDRFLDYKEKLISGIDDKLTYDGRRVDIDEHRPFHFFLIADMTKALKIKCSTRLNKIEGVNSYAGYVKEVGYVHALSYEDLISNSKLRHEMFFNKLGIGMTR